MKKAILVLTVALGIGLGTKYVVDKAGDGSLVDAVRKYKAKSYLEDELPLVMADLEKELGIHFQEVPNLGFDWKPNKGEIGDYNSDTNTISVDYRRLLLPFEGINNWLNFANYGNCIEVQEVLRHELGHFYADKIRESLMPSELMALSQQRITKLKTQAQQDPYLVLEEPEFQALLAVKIMDEGIGEYFEQGPISEFYVENIDWPHNASILVQPGQLYYWGHRLVTPIIQQHGQRGIEYLVLHPPQDPTMLDRYLQEALQVLSSQTY